MALPASSAEDYTWAYIRNVEKTAWKHCQLQ